MSLSDKKIHMMTEKSNLIVKEGVNDFRFNIRDVKESISKIRNKKRKYFDADGNLLHWVITLEDFDKELGKELI